MQLPVTLVALGRSTSLKMPSPSSSELLPLCVHPPPPDAVSPLTRLPSLISAVPPSLKRPPPPDAELPETTVSSIFSVPPFQIPPPPPPPPPPVTAPPSNITDTVVFEESVLDSRINSPRFDTPPPDMAGLPLSWSSSIFAKETLRNPPPPLAPFS